MDNKRIVFMGTSIFSAKIFKNIIEQGYNVIAVVSQPDKPIGRHRTLNPTPLKEAALEYNIPVLQPKKIKEDYQDVLDLKPDLIITCAYGQMIPNVILEFPKYGCINIHASLLPKLRGGAPIHKAIMYGYNETGITIMKMVEKMDAGDMIAAAKVTITDNETFGTLHDKLIKCASDLFLKLLPKILDQSIAYVTQDESQATYAYNISKEEEMIKFDRSYDEVYRHIRSLIPTPVGYSEVNGKSYRFHKVRRSNAATTKASGTIIGLIDNGLAVACDNKIILIDEIQPAGKSILKAKDFYNGAGKKIVGCKFTL